LTQQRDDQNERRRITLELPHDVITWIDRFRSEWGLRGRGPTVERLLRELFDSHDDDAESRLDEEVSSSSHESVPQSPFDESGALVLISKPQGGDLEADFIHPQPASTNRTRMGVGIDLPGFVRRQSDQLKRSVATTNQPDRSARDTFAMVDSADLEAALDAARAHWFQLYGTEPNAHVLESAMTWLSSDIWAQADQSEGRPFSWSLACTVTTQLAPSWPPGNPSFEKVIVMAGLLEDPFSAATLSLRIPTLVRRFVNRFRKRHRGMSFETLQHTMSLHGALKMLQLPTAPGHRLTLADIREAYREQALQHHPDSGGSAEQMRRLNEAYQMLKELYRAS
jgi:hypothetical protein